MTKIALVLSGGGFRGAFQVGAMQALKENWQKIKPGKSEPIFDIVSGVSVGALNGLLMAQNKLTDLEDIWTKIGENGLSEIYHSEFIDTHLDQDTDNPKLKYKISWRTIKDYFPETAHNLLSKAIFNRKAIFNSFEGEFRKIRSLADNSPLLEKLRKYARKERFDKCRFKCGFVSLDDGNYYSVNACDFDSDEDFAKGVLASTSMPIIWAPVDQVSVVGKKIKQCVDGGIRCVSPLRYIIEDIKNDSSPEEYTVIVINCSTGKINKEDYRYKNIAEIALRSLDDIAITEIFNNDIRDFVTKNDFVKQIKEIHPEETVYDYNFEKNQRGKPLFYFKSIIIQPDENILGDPLTANARQIKMRIEHGRSKALMALDIHKNSEPGNRTTIV